MRKSLTATCLAWGLFTVVRLSSPDTAALNMIGASAVLLTALWLLHVATYAGRAVRQWRAAGERISPAHEAHGDRVDRRRAFAVLARAAGIGVVASIPVALWPTAGFAFCGQCSKNEHCGVGFVCRNTAPVNSGTVCNECVRA